MYCIYIHVPLKFLFQKRDLFNARSSSCGVSCTNICMYVCMYLTDLAAVAERSRPSFLSFDIARTYTYTPTYTYLSNIRKKKTGGGPLSVPLPAPFLDFDLSQITSLHGVLNGREVGGVLGFSSSFCYFCVQEKRTSLAPPPIYIKHMYVSVISMYIRSTYIVIYYSIPQFIRSPEESQAMTTSGRINKKMRVSRFPTKSSDIVTICESGITRWV